MKRSPMKPGKGFKRPEVVRVRAPLVPRAEQARATMNAKPRKAVTIEKAKLVRDEGYRRLVASLPCWLCGCIGQTQAAHGDEGKGMQLKACDLTCWPGCGPNNGIPGCHYTVGSTGMFSRAERRALEQQAAADTKKALIERARTDPKARAILVRVGLIER